MEQTKPPLRMETVTRSVYIIGAWPTSIVKIGIADCPKLRLRALRDSNDRTLMPPSVIRSDLVVLHQELGGRAIERALHHRFASRRVLGEWFDLGPVAVSLIRGMIRDLKRELDLPPRHTA